MVLRSVLAVIMSLWSIATNAAVVSRSTSHKAPKKTVEFLPAVPHFTIDGTVAGVYDATPKEAMILDEIGNKENKGDYTTIHFAIPGQPLPEKLSDIKKTKVMRNSHAFGKFGFQPRTYEVIATRVGFDPEDISPIQQDIAALHLLRKVGFNSPFSWSASMGGR